MRLGMLAALLLTGATSAQTLTTPPIKAPATPFTETRFGQAVDDPYRWMEDPARKADMVAWVRAQSDAATAQLRALPNRAAIAQLIESAARAGTRMAGVRVAGPYTFWRQLDPGDRVAKLMVRTGAASRILYDPAKESGNPAGPASINSYSVSPDGRTVALHASYGGAELAPIRFLDTATGKETLARLDPSWGEFLVSWLDGGKIIYTRMGEKRPGHDAMEGMTAFVGTPGGTFTPILGPDVAGGPSFDRTAFPLITTAPTSEWAYGLAANAGSDPFVYIARRADLAGGRPAWRRIAGPEDKIDYSGVALRGDDIYLTSMRTVSDGQVLRIPAAGGNPKPVPMPPGYVLANIVATTDGLYVLGRRDGVSHLFWLAGGTGPAREVKLPFESEMLGLDATADGAAVTVTLEGWTTAPRSYLIRAGRLSPLGIDSVSWAGAAKLVVHRDSARSADGTDVPMVIIDDGAAGAKPALIEAYGAYGQSNTTPWYNAYFMSWSARGNVMVYCGTRGGGERGRAWTDAGRRENKPNGHADLIACTERLIATGRARSKGVAITGASAAGLLVPLAAQKRPDLFGALLARVAMLNPTRLDVADNGANQYGEVGDPRTESGWRSAALQDAYLGLVAAQDLPDTMLNIGLNDHRVSPWMTAKFAARAQAKFGDKRLILLRADAEGGHGVGSARDLQVAEFADSFAFLENRLAAATQR